MSRTVFVTVGTTSFDQLISTLGTFEAYKIFGHLGYTNIVFQIGRGNVLPEPCSMSGLTVETYCYKKSLHADFVNADLIISHAGAGSVMEALRLHRPLLVVVNEALMHNHQTELAEKMRELGHCHWTVCSSALHSLLSEDFSRLTPLTSQGSQSLARVIALFATDL